ncbi:serine hydrolase domain-containing protein [Pedobacter nutrimenti]|uniref:CubicO group peptidase (Beta-lactamase class C family) n=1 Tax=Pedobacter nutrimenti TaxID=1241337 RepID=A0A318UFS4_9SPHI|nr:serine hydrolase domain-containing protein [Pedobacter nutrimenti]PYF74340.1 CubicO group peptidase (beta-lactamase class C family) [Pedobacter nutrimenti]
MTQIRILFICLFLSVKGFSQRNAQQKLDSVFSMMYAQHQFNGTVLIEEGGKIIFSKAYGHRDTLSKHKNTQETIYELASCSKQFTAAAILLLHRKGMLQYEDSLTKFIPELSVWKGVRIYDLLRHTSGIPEYIADMQNGWDRRKIATNDDLIRFYSSRKDTLLFAPGSKHRYCNTNYALLATIAERVSGLGFAELLKEYIFSPLNMKNTFVYNHRQHPQKIKNRATGYVWKKNSFDKITSENPNYGDSLVFYLDGIVGNAKVNSTVNDIYKWITALKNNSFFTPEEFGLMTAITKTPAGKSVSYGFGLELSGGNNNLSFGHTGSWDGYTTFIYHNMRKNRTIIILQNFNLGANPYQTINQILDNKPINIEYPKKIELPFAEIEKFAGYYTDEANKAEQQEITFLNGYLVHNSSKVKWDMRFFPIAKDQFQGIRQGGADAVLKFTDMENGDTKLEMLQYGKVIGTSVKKNKHN